MPPPSTIPRVDPAGESTRVTNFPPMSRRTLKNESASVREIDSTKMVLKPLHPTP